MQSGEVLVLLMCSAVGAVSLTTSSFGACCVAAAVWLVFWVVRGPWFGWPMSEESRPNESSLTHNGASTNEDDCPIVQNHTAENACALFWQAVLRKRSTGLNESPEITTLISRLPHMDFQGLFQDPCDTCSSPYVFCAQGYVCKVAIQWFEHGYSGLFARADHGLLRMSSGLKPPKWLPYGCGTLRQMKLLPCVSLKLFRDRSPTGNIMFMGRKTGQPSEDFWEHCVCSHLTTTMSAFLRILCGAHLTRYTSYPMQLGLSHLATHKQDGSEVEHPSFPWAMCLQPLLPRGGTFPSQFTNISVGTPIYDIFAMAGPSSEGRRVGRIGRIVATSEVVGSGMHLVFKHQRKEEDHALRPGWKLTHEDGRIGWEEFERLISAGGFADLERAGEPSERAETSSNKVRSCMGACGGRWE